jgi:hypothetical protein
MHLPAPPGELLMNRKRPMTSISGSGRAAAGWNARASTAERRSGCDSVE